MNHYHRHIHSRSPSLIQPLWAGVQNRHSRSSSPRLAMESPLHTSVMGLDDNINLMCSWVRVVLRLLLFWYYYSYYPYCCLCCYSVIIIASSMNNVFLLILFSVLLKIF